MREQRKGKEMKVSYRQGDNQERKRTFPLTSILVIVGIVAALVVTTLLTCTVRVRHGTVRPVAKWGRLTGEVMEPGLHWRWPIMESTINMPTVVQSYETSDHPDESKADHTDYPVGAQTIDGQQVTVKYTVLFRVPVESAIGAVQNVGRMDEIVENVIKAHSRNLTRLLAQGYTAETLYSGDGIFDYQETVREQLAEDISQYGIALDDFLVRKVEFDADYIAAIEQQQIAQEAIKTAQYQAEAAEHERDRQITLAEAEKQRNILLAEAGAEQTRLQADAEAYSITARGKALRANPELVQWEFVKNLDVTWGILPDSSVTPLLPVPSVPGQ